MPCRVILCFFFNNPPFVWRIWVPLQFTPTPWHLHYRLLLPIITAHNILTGIHWQCLICLHLYNAILKECQSHSPNHHCQKYSNYTHVVIWVSMKMRMKTRTAGTNDAPINQGGKVLFWPIGLINQLRLSGEVTEKPDGTFSFYKRQKKHFHSLVCFLCGLILSWNSLLRCLPTTATIPVACKLCRLTTWWLSWIFWLKTCRRRSAETLLSQTTALISFLHQKLCAECKLRRIVPMRKLKKMTVAIVCIWLNWYLESK